VAEKKLRERREFIERYSSLEDTSRLENIERDLHKKRGMVEEINRSVREMEEDEKQLIRIRERDNRDESRPIEPASADEPESKRDKDVNDANDTPGSGKDKPAAGDKPPANTAASVFDGEPATRRSDE